MIVGGTVIIIQKLGQIPDGGGGFNETGWVDFATERGRVTTQGSTPIRVADSIQAEVSYAVFLRTGADVAVGDRLKVGSDRYIIASIEPYPSHKIANCVMVQNG